MYCTVYISLIKNGATMYDIDNDREGCTVSLIKNGAKNIVTAVLTDQTWFNNLHN